MRRRKPSTLGLSEHLAASLCVFASCHLNPEVPMTSTPLGAQGQGSQSGNESRDTHSDSGEGQEGVVGPLRAGFVLGLGAGGSDPHVQVGLDAGYRIGGHVELGMIAGLDGEDLGEFSDSGVWYAGPSARIYFVDRGQLVPWLTVAVGAGSYSFSDYEYGYGYEDKSDATFYRAGLGISYFASPRLALDASIAWRRFEESGAYSSFYGGGTANEGEVSLGISTFF